MKKIIIHSQDNLRLINVDDILACKSDNCYSTVFLHGGEKLVMCKSLTKLYKELDPAMFIRANQSFIINKNFIKSINKKNKLIDLVNFDSVPFTGTLKELLADLNL